MCLKWDFFGIEENRDRKCKQLQIRIISENIFSLILMVYRHRILGYPIGGITGTPASPVRIDTISHKMQACPSDIVHTKGKWQIAPAW